MPLNAQYPQRVFETSSTTEERSSLEPSSRLSSPCRRIGFVFLFTPLFSPPAASSTQPLGSSEGSSSSGFGSFLDRSRASAGEKCLEGVRLESWVMLLRA